MPNTRSLDEIRTALQDCYTNIEALCADLSDAQWQKQSLCPDWNVRDVVNHVTSIEAVMAGWLPEDDKTPPPFERAAEFLGETEGGNPAFVDKVRAVYDRLGIDCAPTFEAAVIAYLGARPKGARGQHQYSVTDTGLDLAALTDADLARPSWMPVGPGTYGRFLEIRVFDFWVHERDITTALGRKTDDTGIAAEIALAEVEGSIGYIAGKKVGVPDGKSITFRLTGPIVRDINVAVDGRAKRIGRLDNPDATLITDSTTFIQLACGRIDPQVPIDSGAVSWQGDDELGERAARNLRFTM